MRDKEKISHIRQCPFSHNQAKKSCIMRTGMIARKLSSRVKRNVVLVDGCRIPFALAGTTYNDYLAVDLARMALKGILNKTALESKEV